MTIIIIKDFIVNLTILISVLFFYSRIMKDSQLHQYSPLSLKLIMGLAGGITGIILMVFSIHGSFLIDLRHIPIILLAYYGRGIPAFICAVLIIVGDFIINKDFSFEVIIVIFLIASVSILITSRNMSSKSKVFLSLTASNVILVIAIYVIVLNDNKHYLISMALHVIFTYLAGYASFHLIEYIRASNELFNKYKLESSIDSLTGLNNVRKFNHISKELMKNATTRNEALTLLYIDIDYFKKINDAYGHKEGDKVLKEVGALLKSSTRPPDIVSRNGGEEFTVILVDCSTELSYKISERIRKSIENHLFILSNGESLKVTVSIGMATFDKTVNDISLLIEKADKALYQAKSLGRNQVVYKMN